MSGANKKKVVQVDTLVIHANNVKIVQDDDKKKPDYDERPVRDPWGFLWGRPRQVQPIEDDDSSKKDY